MELPDGLVLRTAVPADLDQITQLLTDRGDAADAVDLELMVHDPDSGWDLCAVVVDGDRVVSTASLVDERLHIAGIELPAGQVDMVATDPAYEGRGLVRALMRWAHDLSAARGHLLQVMVGIPYFYRLFGYAYSIDIPPLRDVTEPPVASGSTLLRPATAEDIAALQHLQEGAQSGFDVSIAHSPARWRWLVAHDSSTTHVLERDGQVAASARVLTDDDSLLVTEAAAVDEAAALDLLALLGAGGRDLSVADRRGTATAAAWEPHLDEVDPLAAAQQYYVRVADPTAVLDRLRPLLWQRLQAYEGDLPPELVLSSFGAHWRMTVGPDGLGAVRAGGPLQGPGAAGGAGVAPDRLGDLLFGQRGIEGLTRRHPDVYPGPHRELFAALFPPVTADLLIFYVPY